MNRPKKELEAAARNAQYILDTVPMVAEPHNLMLHIIRILKEVAADGQ